MAVGDKVWSSAGKNPTKFESTPITPGEYQGKLRTKDATIGKKPEPGKFPYISYKIEVLDTATEGGKNRQLFPLLFTSLKPGKDGKVMPERADQFLGLLRALGVESDVPTTKQKDEHGNEVACLSSTHLLNWLKQQDGSIIKLHVKTQKGENGYGPKSVVGHFVETDEAAPEGFNEDAGVAGEDQAEAEASEETQYVDEDGNPVDAEGNPIEQEEARPAPKAVAKPAPKKAAPALKAVAGKKR